MRTMPERDESSGQYASDIATLGLLSQAGAVALARRIRAGGPDARAARNELAAGNVRLVITIAVHYGGRGLEWGDLIQEGNLGLLRACEKFDPDLGYRFSTYATYWIRQAMGRAIVDRAHAVRLPNHVAGALGRAHRADAAWQQEHERPASCAELAALTGCDAERLQAGLRAAETPVSLDIEVGEEPDGALTVADMEVDPLANVEEEVQTSLFRHEVWTLLADLPPREARVLARTFGLGTEREETLDAIARDEHLSRERVRQIKEEAIGHVRTDPRARRLYCGNEP